jgi:hypothetical protein
MRRNQPMPARRCHSLGLSPVASLNMKLNAEVEA